MTNFFTIVIIILSTVFMGCQIDSSIGIEQCLPTHLDSSRKHPQHQAYSALLASFHAQGFPGFALAVLDSTDRLWLGAAGAASMESRIPLQPCHLHHSASVSKLYIATTILKLFEAGKLDIHAMARQYLPQNLPELANLRTATVLQLLNHSSGIPDFDDDPLFYVETFNNPFTNTSWKDYLIKYVEGKKAQILPGQDYLYSNTNYLLLGLMIEHVLGQSLGDAVRDVLFHPMGLHETYYKSSTNYPSIVGVTENYFAHYNEYLQNGTRLQHHFANISMGHEGIIASPRDYAIFLKKLMRGDILSPATLAQMQNFRIGSTSNIGYGLGMFSYPTQYGNVIGHNGGGFGTMTFLFYIPESKTTVFYATNLGSIFQTPMSTLFYGEFLNRTVRVMR